MALSPHARVRHGHVLKTWPRYFNDVATGAKTFEVRAADRDFRVGDLLYLREWDQEDGKGTGRKVVAEVTYICDLTVFAGRPMVGMGIKLVEPAAPDGKRP